eukprot:363453-Chlamydomonas_euryale.AAC.4
MGRREVWVEPPPAPPLAALEACGQQKREVHTHARACALDWLGGDRSRAAVAAWRKLWQPEEAVAAWRKLVIGEAGALLEASHIRNEEGGTRGGACAGWCA